jgi:hypothetical protein
MKLCLYFLLLAFTSSASAQSDKTHPATESEFIGYWKIKLIPNEKHRSQFRNEDVGYSEKCQFLIFKQNGEGRSITFTNISGEETSPENCTLHKSDIDLGLISSTQVINHSEWQKVPKQEGLFFTKDSAKTDSKASVALLWKVDYVLEDIDATTAFGFNLKKGDMIMQVTRRLSDNSVAPVWPMVLRPVQE